MFVESVVVTLWNMVLFVGNGYLTDTVWDVNVGGSLSVWYRRMGFGSAPLLMDWTERFRQMDSMRALALLTSVKSNGDKCCFKVSLLFVSST